MTIFEQAHKLITDNRRKEYGPVEESFQRIAMLWNAILYKKLSSVLTKEDVALMMIVFKASRESNKHSRDNLTDICGYTGLLAMMQGDFDEKENT